MKRLIIPVVLAVSAWAGTCYNFVRADDHQYVGVHVTVPFSFDGFGIQIVGRNESFEARAGYDSRHEFQIGGGVTTGTEFVASGGAAYSSHAGKVVPYAAGAYGTGDWEAGAVSYGLDSYTSYVFAGYRAGRDRNRGGGDQPAGDGKANPPDDNVVGKKPGTPNPNDGKDSDPTDGNAGGGNDGRTDDNGGGSGGSGGGDTDGGNDNPGNGQNPGGGGGSGGSDGPSGGGNGDDSRGNRSGLGDGTNPGRGSGRDHSPNTGTDNPHHEK